MESRKLIGISFTLIVCCTLILCRDGFCDTRADAAVQYDILNNLIRIDPNTGDAVQPEIVSQKFLSEQVDATA